MCGILGSVNFQIDNQTLNLIKHRGPDASGLNKYDLGQNAVTLGHRRLSIIDVSEAGNQPMISDCGNYIIIFNGEIYNHKDLKKKINDIRFKGHSDTETILYYMVRFGIESVSCFNGIFALALLDKKSRKLFLVRDPVGVKPLYYYKSNKSFIFSSEIRPIVNLLNTDDYSAKNLANLLKLRYIPSPNTLNDSVFKVSPGEVLEVNLSGDRLKYKSRSFLKFLPKIQNISFEKAQDLYKIKIEEAVERQLMSDVPVGILLSGGIDSAIVASIAREKLGYKLKAFTIGFEGNEFEDEIKDASVTAKILDLDHYYEKISFENFLEIIDKCSQIVEEPLATTSFVPMYYLANLASKHVKVVLTGQGADEPLGGYQRYQGELIRNKLPSYILNPLLGILSKAGTKSERILRAVDALKIDDKFERFEHIYSIFTDQEIREMIGINDNLSSIGIRNMYDKIIGDNQKTPTEQMMALDVRLNLADDLLIYTDKITMHYALECRVPMLDHDLLEFIEALPLNYKVGFKKTKIIHKVFAKKILPNHIISRRKKGFLSPTRIWFDQYLNLIREILLSRNSKLSLVINPDAIEKILLSHQKGFNKEKQIFLLLSLYYWFERSNSERLRLI